MDPTADGSRKGKPSLKVTKSGALRVVYNAPRAGVVYI